MDKFSPANNNNAPTGGAKIKSKTKYYRWYNLPWPLGGIWLREKTTITARLEFDKGIVCGNGDILPSKYETRKASKRNILEDLMI